MILKRIQKSLNESSFTIHSKILNIEFSYATYTYSSDTDLTGSELFRIVDKKLYDKKRSWKAK